MNENDVSIILMKKKTTQIISNLIDAIIEKRKMTGTTQNELAYNAGMSQSSIARFESKKHIPHLETLLKICLCLDFDILSI
jgi:transcriptional regulator with XRE-family HTH domain